MAQGIYLITNLATGQKYVGSSTNIVNKIRQHTTALRHGRHSNWALQNDWVRDGGEAFETRILEEVEDPGKLPEREQYWINYYQSDQGYESGYNTPGQLESVPYTKLSEDQVKQIRKRFGPPIVRGSGRLQSPFGISMTDLAKEYGVSVELISQIIHGKTWKST